MTLKCQCNILNGKTSVRYTYTSICRYYIYLDATGSCLLIPLVGDISVNNHLESNSDDVAIIGCPLHSGLAVGDRK